MVLIRPYTMTDAAQINALIASRLGSSAETLVSLFEPAYVAERDGKIVGYVSATLKHPDHAQGRNFVMAKEAEGWITCKRLVVALEKDLWRRGVTRYRGRLRGNDDHFLRMAIGWGGRVISQEDGDYIVEIDLMKQKERKRVHEFIAID